MSISTVFSILEIWEFCNVNHFIHPKFDILLEKCLKQQSECLSDSSFSTKVILSCTFEWILNFILSKELSSFSTLPVIVSIFKNSNFQVFADTWNSSDSVTRISWTVTFRGTLTSFGHITLSTSWDLENKTTSDISSIECQYLVSKISRDYSVYRKY